MKAGQPTKYSEETLTKVDEYLASQKEALKEKTAGGFFVEAKLPTHEGLALFLNVSVKTLYNWSDAHDQFFQALEKIKAVQKAQLLERGLEGTYNPTIAKLILSHNHGMRETTEQVVRTENVAPEELTEEELQREIDERRKSLSETG